MTSPLYRSIATLAAAMAVSALSVALLYQYVDPRWMTNDDIAMSMVAHGYGLTDSGSPNLFFSNVLWGYLVRAIPTVNGMLGYSIATVSALVIAGSTILFVLWRLGTGFWISLLIFALIMVRPALFPQFTINAGLLSLAAIACWRLYALNRSWQALAAGCALLLLGFLERNHEALIVLILGLPLLPWRTLARLRPWRPALVVLAAILVCATWFDKKPYEGAEWASFNALNLPRAAFTDFGAMDSLRKRPDILARYGYTHNDLDLLRHWFFVDPTIADPEKLNAMLRDLGPLPVQSGSLDKAWLGVQMLWYPDFVPLLVLAALLGIAYRSRRAAITWALCVSAVFFLGLAGRPGILHVYYPLLATLLLAPLLAASPSRRTGPGLAAAIAVTCALNAGIVLSQATAMAAGARELRADLAGFPQETVVIWGSNYPYEAMFGVLKIEPAAWNSRFYGLGVFTLAPFTVSYAEQHAGRGLPERLQSQEGIPILASDVYIARLATYCAERHHGQLRTLAVQQYGPLTLSRQQCK